MKRAILAALVVAGAGFSAGCQAVAFPFTVIAGPPTIKAVYPLAERSTVVMVDDPNGKLPQVPLGTLLAAAVGRELEDEQVVPRIISPTAVDEVRHNHADFAGWPIDRVGKAVGAEQVVYLVVQDFQLTEDEQIIRPQITVRIKVVDATDGARLFPAGNKKGYAITHNLFYRDMADAPTTARAVLARRLMEETGGIVAKLFYSHKAPEMGSGLPG